jgi:DNA-binding PadR family transcriptional regulator
MYRRVLDLTPTGRAELERVRDRDPRAYLRERAGALLKIADGQAAWAVARAGLLRRRKPDTVYAWLTRYQHAGLVGLLQEPRRRRGLSPPGAGGAAADGTPGA